MDRQNDHSGHRQRLIEKMQNEGLSDYEILELLLFYVFKRRNTNDLAHRLMARFGGLRQLFSADVESIQEVDGIGRQAAVFLYALGRCNHNTNIKKDCIELGDLRDYNVEEFVQLIKKRYDGLQTEVLDIFLLDSTGSICFSRRFYGSADNVMLPPNEFAQIIIDVEPSGLIAVHNHPSGSKNPSQKDEEMTRTCQLICSFHNVLFCDHIILGEGGYYSYYKEGKMGELGKQFSINYVRKGGTENLVQSELKYDYPKVFKKNLNNFTIEQRDGKFVGVIKE